MEWQAIVLAMQILLLAVGWLLFQKARGELSARAAETPVLTEIKALQRNVKQLLAEIETTADLNASRLEQRCTEARDLIQALDHQLAEAEEILQNARPLPQELQTAVLIDTTRKANVPETDGELSLRPAAQRSRGRKTAKTPASGSDAGVETTQIVAAPPLKEGKPERKDNSTDSTFHLPTLSLQEQRRQTVFRMADAGESFASIARATQLSEGEVETLLGLRLQRS
jgi:hypothetical protein